MTFKEAYFSNVVWQPDTILRIMINMDGVSIFEEANKAAVKYGHLHVFYLRDCEIEWENRYTTINFDTDKEQKREICKSFYSDDYKLGYAETLIEKYMSFKYLIYGIPKGESYRSAIFMELDELEEEVNYYRAKLKSNGNLYRLSLKHLLIRNSEYTMGKTLTIKTKHDNETITLKQEKVMRLLYADRDLLESQVIYFTPDTVFVALPEYMNLKDFYKQF